MSEDPAYAAWRASRPPVELSILIPILRFRRDDMDRSDWMLPMPETIDGLTEILHAKNGSPRSFLRRYIFEMAVRSSRWLCPEELVR